MKTAIITGSNRGIGKGLVRAFAGSGYEVWACARKEDAQFEEQLKELSAETGSQITPVYFDLSDEEDTKEGVKRILAEKKDIDVLINNAGMAHSGLINMTSVAKMKEIFDINFFAQVQMMQLVSRRMMRQKHGCIINMCSVGGMEAYPGYAAYGASKASLIWLTRCAARELADYHIRVNGIAPGLIDTEMGHTKSEQEIEKVMERMTIKRMGETEEVARTALFLASDDSAFINGQILVIDGGRCI